MLYRSSEDNNNNVVARQATSWATAAKLYIAANYDSLLASAPTTISRSTLVNSGYLNSGVPEINLFQQTWKVAVRKNTKNSNQLDAVLLSSGGQAMDYPTLRYIAAAIDGYGGFVYSGSMPSGCTSSTTTVNGAACGWTLDLSGFGISTTSGHLAVNLGADIAASAGSGGDFLHRYSVPGHAEYNQMNTALDMNGKNVNRAGNLLVTSDGKSSDDHGSSGSTGFVGWASGSASGTASDATSLRAGMYFSTSAPSSSDKESVWIKTTSNTSLDVTGKVRAATVKGTRLITSEGYLMPGKTVTANTSCTPAALGISDLLADTTGLVAHDSTGATLSCQSGLWKKNSSGSTVLTGRIANGQQIPLPSGFSANQCTWSVSNAENPHGWKPNYFAGSVATYDSNRIVKCGYYDEYNFHGGTNRTDLTGKCSYVVSCQS
ncbi:shufflon system plasmid conjugative transfer pilus tip adhesin PilV [Salmonella enterica]|uniref:Shufflon system plasmid conjugative transfer pilus tip adhesin PilV n=10 Tax=Enterobacterales TaxID=91347 RepID=A0A723FVT5_SALER|nr:shufflon system plasmid conjugative transfer pilus tip adhesin PilV [Salmonella enterica]EDP9289682.1 shufflon system plasmid conjugative transfer pilus tip adhesin PilV [Salmonella enterica subsp. enterica serovar Javiana]EFF9552376.1 shufflon system plasmid conjugative transfer pilus tip adhesin PilV [Escherichia coli]EAS1161951.1 shufflon system plasmid conjugative transfer pilus tip adhesin PilV [Salmonella enterica]EBD9634651.1 shufflon system plasmid conjugative transfer pilus tip adhe